MRAIVLVVLATAGCPAPSVAPCSATTCAGCCSLEGRCELGQSETQCGRFGAACTVCGVGLECSTGMCSAIIGSGGGTAATGGGTSVSGGGTGGGTVIVGRSEQELVSGSRLRAIHIAGADGSKAPAGLWGGLFWDNLRQEYCVPTSGAVPVVCGPIAVSLSAVIADGGTVYSPYADAACTRPLGSPPSLYSGHIRNIARTSGLPALEMTHFFQGDGGAVHFTRGTPYTGAVYSPNPCRLVGETMAADTVVDTGAIVTNLAPMSFVRD